MIARALPDPADTRSLRRIGAVTLLLGAFLATLAVYAVHGSMPTNALPLPGEKAVQTIAWLPEGWKFFTRDPQEPQAFPFVRENGIWHQAWSTGGSPQYAFGLDRRGRAQGVEIGLLLGGAPRSLFESCKEADLSGCLQSAATQASVDNIIPNPTLCGDVAIVEQKPMPWAWASEGSKAVMPRQILRIFVRC
jgi:antimicrobial peptide system SdpA family protein